MKLPALVLATLIGVTSTAAAQQPKPAATPPPKDSTPAPAQPALRAPAPKPFNVRIEFTITDQTDAGTPGKKSVSMIVSDRRPGSVRSRAVVLVNGAYREINVNVDATAEIQEDDRLRLDFGLEYQPQAARAADSRPGSPTEGMAGITERLSLLLQSGKPMTVSQAVDPTSDRKVTVDVTATILK